MTKLIVAFHNSANAPKKKEKKKKSITEGNTKIRNRERNNGRDRKESGKQKS